MFRRMSGSYKYVFVCWHCLWCGKIDKQYTQYERPPAHPKCTNTIWEALYRAESEVVDIFVGSNTTGALR